MTDLTVCIALCQKLVPLYTKGSLRARRTDKLGFTDKIGLASVAGRKDFVLQRQIWFTAGFKFAKCKLVVK